MGGAAAIPLLSPLARAQTSGRHSVAANELPGIALKSAPELPHDAWSIVVLPDTQKYSYSYPEVFLRQTEWIVANREARNIRFVLHEGDITDRNTHPEWMNARRAMDVLLRGQVPFVLVPGNHDIGEWGSTRNRMSLLNEYFSRGDCVGSHAWGVMEFGHLENAWHSFRTPWGPFLVVALEYAPPDEAVAWATQVVEQHQDHHAILLTHSYLYSDSSRYDWGRKGESQKWAANAYGVSRLPGTVNDGEQLWEKLVSRHRNFLLTFNGHVLNDGTGYLASTGVHGNEVHQMLANFQTGVKPDRGFGGGGFLRIVEFQPDRQTIKVFSYSPWYDRWLTEDDQQFVIRLHDQFPVAASQTGVAPPKVARPAVASVK